MEREKDMGVGVEWRGKGRWGGVEREREMVVGMEIEREWEMGKGMEMEREIRMGKERGIGMEIDKKGDEDEEKILLMIIIDTANSNNSNSNKIKKTILEHLPSHNFNRYFDSTSVQEMNNAKNL